MTYGPHLTIDIEGASYLNDFDYIYRFLENFPSQIGMTKITKPYVIRYTAPNHEESGITGFVMIAESHISIHTYPHKDYAFIDVFSCKPFDIEPTVTSIKRMFKAGNIEHKCIERGKNFPRSSCIACGRK